VCSPSVSSSSPYALLLICCPVLRSSQTDSFLPGSGSFRSVMAFPSSSLLCLHIYRCLSEHGRQTHDRIVLIQNTQKIVCFYHGIEFFSKTGHIKKGDHHKSGPHNDQRAAKADHASGQAV